MGAFAVSRSHLESFGRTLLMLYKLWEDLIATAL